MKFLKLSIVTAVLLAGLILLPACADLSVDNTNAPSREAVLGSAENTISLLNGAYSQAFISKVSSWGTHPNMLADQLTSTNLFRQYWDFTEEPRLRLNNTTVYSATPAFTGYWGSFNSAIATANLLIESIDVQGVQMVVDGENVTQKIRAQAFFLRGLSRGYLGLIYDQGYFLDENFDQATDASTIAFEPASVLIQGAVDDIDEAIATANETPNFRFDSTPNPDNSWNTAEFVTIANSYAARFLAGEARTAQEAAGLNWQRILTYANGGIGGPQAPAPGLTDFTINNVGASGQYANYMADWSNFLVACGGTIPTCSGYNPTDVKLIHLLDPNYPTTYPAAFASSSEASFPAAESDDPRIGYYVYTTNPGFLNPARNPNLYSNYFSIRAYAGNDWWQSTLGVTHFTHVENDLLRVEANLFLSNPGVAADILNQTPSGTGTMQISVDMPGVTVMGLPEEDMYTSGGHSYDATTSLAMFQWALLREYSVEIDYLTSVGTQWFFMRRHDLLQRGTATHFAVPGDELDLTLRDYYTFGGVDFAGQPGSASGDNSWTELAAKAFGGGAGKSLQGSATTGGKYSPIMDLDISTGNIGSGNEVRRNQ